MKPEYKEELSKILPLLQSEDNESRQLGIGLFKECKFYLDLMGLKNIELYIFDNPDDDETELHDFLNYCFSGNQPYGAEELGEWIRGLLKGTSRVGTKQVVKSILIDFSLYGH